MAGHLKAWREFSWRGGGGTRLASKATPLFASLTNVPLARFFELLASILNDLTPKRSQFGPIVEQFFGYLCISETALPSRQELHFHPKRHPREGNKLLIFMCISLEQQIDDILSTFWTFNCKSASRKDAGCCQEGGGKRENQGIGPVGVLFMSIGACTSPDTPLQCLQAG